jgi:ribonuclease HI
MSEYKKILVYTDGSSLGNPGPGGYGVVMCYNGMEKEFSGGYKMTTNNRMEIMGVIVALRSLKEKCSVELYTDSQYVVNSIKLGWAKRWRAKGWKKSGNEKALNSDLWAELLELVDKHEMTINWVKGHAGHPENERCDILAKNAATAADLQEDRGYFL